MFGHTGVPHFVFAIAVTLAVWTAELVVTRDGQKPEVISVASELSDDYELDTLPAASSIYLNDIAAELIEQIESDALSIEKLDAQSVVGELDQKERIELKAHLARHWLAQKDYNHTTEVLAVLSDRERLQHGLQFSYAYALSKIGESEGALKHYSLLLADQPNHQSAALNAGLLLKKMDRCDQAHQVLSHAIDVSSGGKRAKAYAALAGCEFTLGNYDQAVSDYQSSIEYRPDHALTWRLYARAKSHTDSSHADKLKAYDKAVALASRHYGSHLGKARFQLEYYDYTGAIATLKIAKSLSKNNLETRWLLLWAYMETGKRNSARKQLHYLKTHDLGKKKNQLLQYMQLYNAKKYTELITLFKKKRPKSEEAKYLAGLAYKKARYYKRALGYFSDLTNSELYSGRSRLQIARIYKSRKQYRESRESYAQLLKRNETAAFIWYEMSQLYAREKDYSQALRSIDEALVLSNGAKRYFLAKAEYLVELNQRPKAIAVANKLVETHPRYLRGLRLLAELYVANGKPGKAKKYYAAVLERNPDDVDVLYSLASLHIQEQEHTEARSIMNRLLEERSSDTKARYLLAYSFYQTGEYEACKKELNKVLKLDATHEKARYLQGSILSRSVKVSRSK